MTTSLSFLSINIKIIIIIIIIIIVVVVIIIIIVVIILFQRELLVKFIQTSEALKDMFFFLMDFWFVANRYKYYAYYTL